ADEVSIAVLCDRWSGFFRFDMHHCRLDAVECPIPAPALFAICNCDNDFCFSRHRGKIVSKVSPDSYPIPDRRYAYYLLGAKADRFTKKHIQPRGTCIQRTADALAGLSRVGVPSNSASEDLSHGGFRLLGVGVSYNEKYRVEIGLHLAGIRNRCR